MGKNDYSLLKKDYPNRLPKSHDIIRVKCIKHNYIFTIKYDTHKRGQGCPFCSNRIPIDYWTLEICIEDALKYKTKTEWRLQSPRIYNIARKRKWLNKCCKHMVLLHMPNGYWTLAKCKIESKKHHTKIEWRKKSQSSYNIALSKNWMKICTKHMKLRQLWNFNNCLKTAKKYIHISDWIRNCPGAYLAAKIIIG
jgi:hypothetical protein